MCPFFTTCLLLAVIAVLLYVYLIWNFRYWAKRGVKQAKSYAFVGSFPSLFTQKRNMVYDIEDIYKKYKHTENFVGVYSCRSPQLLVLTPEYAHKIFASDFKSFHDNEFALAVDRKKDIIFGLNPFVLRGQEWKERRAEVTPGLTSNRIGAAYPVTQRSSKDLVSFIRAQQKMAGKNGLNGKEISLRFTTEVVTAAVLGLNAQSFSENPTEIYEKTINIFSKSSAFMIYMAVRNIFPVIEKFWTTSFVPKESETYFLNIMHRALELREKNPVDNHYDFLNYILELRNKRNLGINDLTAHAMSFLTDGFETSALVLSHTLLLLGRNPQVQEKLRQEIGTEEQSFEQLHKLPYLEACIHEMLRIFPALPIGRKICTQPYEFVNKNGKVVKLQPGQIVLVPCMALQTDAEYFENPQQYNPDRFLEENGSGLRKYRDMGLYFGFGDGPRICLGSKFAQTQIYGALVEILRNFRVHVNAKTRTDNLFDETYFMGTLQGGIWLDFEEL